MQDLAIDGVIAGLDLGGFTLAASAASTAPGTAPMLRGAEFSLVIDETPVNFTGRPAMATTINGMLPGSMLRWHEGDTVTLHVINRLHEPTLIHWYGIVLSFGMDNVPGVGFRNTLSGEVLIYRFKIRQSDSYWCHSHSDFQKMAGVYGTLIIDTAGGDMIRTGRDYSVLLSGWTDGGPIRILPKLKTQGDYYNYYQPTVVDFFHDVSNDSWKAAMEKWAVWSQIHMNPTDLADLSNAMLTYLTSSVTPTGNWTSLFTLGETVRLRFINGPGSTFYDICIPGLKLRVVQVDGQNIEPITVDEFRSDPGGTCDVLVVLKNDAYTIFLQLVDRTGYTRDTLVVCRGLRAAVSALDKVEWLPMASIMGNMGGMGGMSHGGMSGMDHGATSGMNHGDMPGMDHGDVQMTDDTDTTIAGFGDMQVMDHNQHTEFDGVANSLKVPGKTARHARTEYGPSTDVHVDMTRTNLDGPGVGLCNDRHRILVLADMHTIGGSMDKRGPEREVELRLTGNMEYYAQSFDGVGFGRSTPVCFRYGGRPRVILHNDTVMTHLMHLHDMWSELEAPDGTLLVRRHTTLVQPVQRVSLLVTADALGRWAWHCHLTLYINAGMFREVVVI